MKINEEFLKEIKNNSKIKKTLNKIKNEKESVFPEFSKIFRAFEICDINSVKVVIIGQDPYHKKGLADGLAFSTESDKCPSSLRNIIIELKREFPKLIVETFSLNSWAKQNILLLNKTLTVVENKPNSHSKIGWNICLDYTIDYINKNLEKVIFLLWGNEAKKLKQKINLEKHIILESSHPSPFSFKKSFYGNDHFLKVNEILEKNNKKKINWDILK